MRQANLAGPWNTTAADESGIGDGVVGRTKGPFGNQGLIFSQQPDNTEYFCGFDGLFK